jgi:hypothetical protein
MAAACGGALTVAARFGCGVLVPAGVGGGGTAGVAFAPADDADPAAFAGTDSVFLQSSLPNGQNQLLPQSDDVTLFPGAGSGGGLIVLTSTVPVVGPV